jgi:succinate dehydrogenase/fumarate reductase flavoprotein subunit
MVEGEGVTDRVRKDVVVIGSGGAGLTCALAAAQAGLDVLLVEKEDKLGGTLSWSGGGVWFPLSSPGRDAGFEDSRDEVLTYLDAIGEGSFDRSLIETYVDTSPELVDMLHSRTEARLIAFPGMGDWFPDAPGARPNGGRALNPVSFDGKRLGANFGRLRLPLQVFNAPGGFMVDLPDIPHLTAIGRSLKSTLYVAKLYARFLADRLRFDRGSRLTMGNALAAALLKAGLDAGAEMWTNAPATGLLRDGDRVTGAIVRRDGRDIEIEATRGVLLASGGFSADAEMRRKYIPFGDQHYSLLSDSNAGDGIRLGREAGGEFIEKGFQHGGWVMLSLVPQEDGSFVKFPHLVNDRPKPGFIAVDKAGERFCNEALLDPISPMHAAGALPAWLVCDAKALRKYGLGPVRPGGIGLKRHLRPDYIVEAPTIEALAGKLGIDPAGLARTVARHNEFARTGEDLDFGRGRTSADRSLGDPSHKPNPNLGEIGTGPFYGLRVHPGDSATMLGLRVDREARVLDAQQRPIEGLYAAGLDMNSIFLGRSPGGGANNGPAMIFGYLAAKSMARGLNRPV